MMEAATLLGVLLIAALAAEAAVLQLGAGRETWTTGIQYPVIHAHINDTLVTCLAQRLQVAEIVMLGSIYGMVVSNLRAVCDTKRRIRCMRRDVSFFP